MGCQMVIVKEQNKDIINFIKVSVYYSYVKDVLYVFAVNLLWFTALFVSTMTCENWFWVNSKISDTLKYFK